VVKHGQADGPVETGIGNLQCRRILLEDSNICSSQTTGERSREPRVNLDGGELLNPESQQIGG
jgi:hypothetical protein